MTNRTNGLDQVAGTLGMAGRVFDTVAWNLFAVFENIPKQVNVPALERSSTFDSDVVKSIFGESAQQLLDALNLTLGTLHSDCEFDSKGDPLDPVPKHIVSQITSHFVFLNPSLFGDHADQTS